MEGLVSVPTQRGSATDLPVGIITYLMTDIEGSTKLWEQFPDGMSRNLQRHDEIVLSVVDRNHGSVVRERGEGDSFFAVFRRPLEAVLAAEAIQRAMQSETWPNGVNLRVRIGVHTGEADLREGDYYGREVNRCARLRGAARGGQTLISNSTAELVRRSLPAGHNLRSLGSVRLRDLKDAENAYELVHSGEELGSRRFRLGRLAGQRRRFRVLINAAMGVSMVLVVGVLMAASPFGQQLRARFGSTALIQDPSLPAHPITQTPPPESPPVPSAPTVASPVPQDLLRSSRQHASGITLQLSSTPVVGPEGKGFRFEVRLANRSGERTALAFDTEQLWDLYVIRTDGSDEGKELFRFSEGKLFRLAPTIVEWGAGEERKFDVNWTPQSQTPGSLPSSYRVHAVLLTTDRIDTELDISILK